MDLMDILFVITLTLVPSGMAWRAYRVGYQAGQAECERRHRIKDRYSRRNNRETRS
ncbi:hypothetical protein SEA_LIZZ_69 [Streptomyces phage Lizz]|nr:hypothetical protein SEA_PHTOWN_69 [Streptomyces phage PHTowN]QNO12886.1 hypothetical protein SEA_SHAKENBAKE_69 [Streptomyces phage ShakeNBake]QYW07616.1 hypothetical protein SEA_LIZZ_69 [Streptomyces phage Lizz]